MGNNNGESDAFFAANGEQVISDCFRDFLRKIEIFLKGATNSRASFESSSGVRAQILFGHVAWNDKCIQIHTDISSSKTPPNLANFK